MPHPYKTPNRFEVEKARLESLIQEVNLHLQDGSITTEDSLVKVLTDAYQTVYANIDTPIFEAQDLDPLALRTPDMFNTPFSKIQHDISNLLRLAPQLADSIQQTYNYVQALEESTRQKLKQAASNQIDLTLLAGSLSGKEVIAGDDFHDTSKIDLIKTPTDSRAEASPFSGFITLRRIDSVSAIDKDAVSVTLSAPQGTYEGHLYAPPGEVVPEGKALSFTTVSGTFSQSQVTGIDPELESRYQLLNVWLQQNPQQAIKLGVTGQLTPNLGQTLSKSTGAFGGLTSDDWNQLAGNFHYTRNFVASSPPTPFQTRTTPNTSAIEVALVPATEEDKADTRKAMFDDSPDTYWQAEFSKDTTQDFNRVVLYDNAGAVSAVPEKSLDQIEQIIQTKYNTSSFSLSLTIDLGAIQDINYLILNPYLADSTCVLRVDSIEVSADGSIFDEIVEIKNGNFALNITDGTNSTLNASEAVLTLTSSTNKYIGQGVFAFSTRQARYIKVSLTELVPVPSPYGIIRFLLSRTITTHYKRDGGLFHNDSYWNVAQNYQKTIDLDYLQTLYLLQNNKSSNQLTSSAPSLPDTLVGTTAGFSLSNGRGSSLDAFQLGGLGVAGTILLSGLSFGLGAIVGIGAALSNTIFGGGTSSTIDDSGWQIADVSDPPILKYDKERYVIGIRELGIFHYKFAEQSELVSVPFKSPKPITTISLDVDESIPDTLAADVAEPIQYYFSVDDGTNWIRIAPLTSTPRRSNGNFVPQIFHVNSGLQPDQRIGTDGYVDTAGIPVQEVRFKVVMYGDPGESGVSPILKSYRLHLLVDGGLVN